jgi:hypothetical protein
MESNTSIVPCCIDVITGYWYWSFLPDGGFGTDFGGVGPWLTLVFGI